VSEFRDNIIEVTITSTYLQVNIFCVDGCYKLNDKAKHLLTHSPPV